MNARARPSLIVLTGGPGAGKTAVLEVVRRTFYEHVTVLPETASILFGGGFPRGVLACEQRAAQRAIFYTQRELERETIEARRAAVILCDRGLLDGLAYWPEEPGTPGLLEEVGVTRDEALERYAAVIHLRTPTAVDGYNHANPVRIESASEAAEIDGRIVAAWSGHPDHHVIASAHDFMEKVRQALAILDAHLPTACRRCAAVPPGATIDPVAI